MLKIVKIVKKNIKIISYYGDYCNIKKLSISYQLNNCSGTDCS